MQQSLEASVFLGGGWQAVAAATDSCGPSGATTPRDGAGVAPRGLSDSAALAADAAFSVLGSYAAAIGGFGEAGRSGSVCSGDGWEGEQVYALPATSSVGF